MISTLNLCLFIALLLCNVNSSNLKGVSTCRLEGAGCMTDFDCCNNKTFMCGFATLTNGKLINTKRCFNPKTIASITSTTSSSALVSFMSPSQIGG